MLAQVHFKGGKYFYALQVTFGIARIIQMWTNKNHLWSNIKLQSNGTNKYPTSVTYNLAVGS
jgi:hypothetical protein